MRLGSGDGRAAPIKWLQQADTRTWLRDSAGQRWRLVGVALGSVYDESNKILRDLAYHRRFVASDSDDARLCGGWGIRV